ncbi:MAG: hypothetical protein KDC32_27615, partial [Saprospiraceae bacterium]|nr:hypothetical protein [Saprospiraceae bacterium]
MGFDDLAEGAVRRFELCRIFEELNGILAMVVDPCGGETPTINVRVMPSIAIPGYFANGQDLPAMDMEVLGLASSYFGVDQQG